MFSSLKYLFSILIIINVCSCASLYVPNTMNVPLFTEKSEKLISVNTGMNGWDLQGAYALTNHVAIVTNASWSPPTQQDGSNFHTHTFVEGGAGYFMKTGESWVFDVYGGYGWGSVASRMDYVFNGNNQTDRVSGYYNRVFIQPSIGLKRNYIELAFSLRGVFLDAYDIKFDNSTELNTAQAAHTEGAFTLRVGKEKLFGHLQVGASIPVTNSASIKYRPFMFSLGMTLRLRSSSSDNSN